MKTIPILILVALLLYNSGAVMAAENIQSEDKSNIEVSEVSVQVFHGYPGESTWHHAIRILKVEVLHEKEPVIVLRLI
ncbi:Uncharacterised protein [uncultured archaeon]|nr:Uncharacterised protein [uncultured archaeon]